MQKDSAADQELILKKRARRRLVGALALVLLMVTMLPMILKDRSQEKAEEQVEITLPGDVASSEPVPSETKGTPSDFDSSVTPGEAAHQQAPQASSEAPHDSEAAPEHAAVESAPVESKSNTEQAKETTKSDNETPAKPEAKADKKFYVQIGVFSDAANVKRLQTKLSELGYTSSTEKMNTPNGQKIRLRTQVFAERNEAAIALQNIKDAGLTGMVVSQ